MAQPTKELHLNIHGLPVRVTTDAEPLRDFLSYYFAPFVRTQGGEPELDVELVREPGFSLKLARRLPELPGSVRYGQDAVFDAKVRELSVSYREVVLKIQPEGEGFKLQANFQANFIRHLANILFFKGLQTELSYNRVLARLAVQAPTFSLLRRRGLPAGRQALSVFSGGAIAVGGKAYAFLGLPGSGKSTVLRALSLELPGSSVLSENFVLVRDGSVLAFPERPVKLPQLSYPLSGAFVLGRGQDFSVGPVSHAELSAASRAVDAFTAEMPEHGPLSVLPLCFPELSPLFEPTAAFPEVPGFRVTVDQNALRFVEYFKATHAR